jgi:hypothetical protein
MADNENLWKLLQTGKLRSDSAQKIFSRKINILFITIISYYSLAFIYFAITSLYYPNLLKIDYLSYLTFFITVSITLIGIKTGFDGYFIQQRTKQEVITYIGPIEYKKVKSLITFINKGDTVLIRNISLIAYKDIKRRFDFLSLPIPAIEIITYTPFFHGWELLREGEFRGIVEQDMKESIKNLEYYLKDEKDIKTINLAVMAFDEEFDLNKFESFGETLLAGCNLGNYLKINEYSKQNEKEFPGFSSGFKSFIHFRKSDLEKMDQGTVIQGITMIESPPSIVDENYEIIERLDRIEKIVNKLVKRIDKNPKKRGESK